MTITIEGTTIRGDGVFLDDEKMMACTKAIVLHLMRLYPDGAVPLFDLMGVCAAELSKVLMLSDEVFETYVTRNPDFNYVVLTLASELIKKLSGQELPVELVVMRSMFRTGIMPPVHYMRSHPGDD